MAVRIRRQLHRRQVDDPVAAPTGVSGIGGAATLTGSLSADSLAFDTLASPGESLSAPPLVPTGDITPVVVITPPVSTPTLSPSGQSPGNAQESGSDSSAPPPIEAQGNASAPISIRTVVGTCVGAFVGAVALIALAWWFYRRYSRSLQIKARSRSSPQNFNPYARSRSAQGKSGKDDEDKWESQYQTKELDHVAPMEKLTMFKSSTPSTKTGYTHADDGDLSHEPLPSLAQYHPALAKELGSRDRVTGAPFLDVDAGSPISWETDLTRPTIQSVQSSRHSIVIPAPTASIADVVIRPQSAEAVNPFEPSGTRSRSGSHDNPFFSAQDHAMGHTRSRSGSSSTVPVKKLDKGKGRAIDPDPFEGESGTSSPRPPFLQHTTAPSTSSVGSNNERALQSLIAVLDFSKEAPRVASMQPSIVSATSAYTETEDDVTDKFPLPPPASGSSQGHSKV
ncbi:hypothetical protein AX16_002405 [Volvariella volvacea WC 439]|nr:hypothetical protein AX16_002405 [Volvariella volvacea WC 439]